MKDKRRVKKMMISLTSDRELLEEKLLIRIDEADRHPTDSVKVAEVLDEKELSEYELIDSTSISDEELFKE